MFSAVRQNVARSFLPNLAKFERPDQHLLRICTAAASENVQLTNRLYEIVSSGISAFGMIDYHHAFNAAIILELACLCQHNDSSVNERPQIGRVLDALQRGGQNGNESARDCSTVLADFRQLSERLMQEMSRRGPAIATLPPPAQSIPVSGEFPSGIFDVPPTSAGGLPVDERLSPGLEFERVLEEFTNWLEEGSF